MGKLEFERWTLDFQFIAKKCAAMWLILTLPDYNGETKAQGTRSAGSPCVSSEVVGRKGEKGAWRQFPALCGEEPAQMSSAPGAQRSPPGSQYSKVRSYLCHGYAVFWEGLQKSLCGFKKNKQLRKHSRNWRRTSCKFWLHAGDLTINCQPVQRGVVWLIRQLLPPEDLRNLPGECACTSMPPGQVAN